MNREALITRRDELQRQYDLTNNHARELAGAIAAYEELIEADEAEAPETTPLVTAEQGGTNGTRNQEAPVTG